MLSKRTEVFNTEKNYWEIFPEMKVHPQFNKLHTEDKTKNKLQSSQIMWALHLVCHPKSMMYHDPNKLRNVQGLLPSSYSLENNPILDTYRDIMLSEAQRALVDWDEMIKKRSTYLKSQEYTLEDGAELDKLHRNTYAIFKDYQKICEELSTEESSNSQTKSLSESGEI